MTFFDVSFNACRYSIFAYQGKRSAQAQHWIDFIKKREWGLLILDEVQTVPADSVCHIACPEALSRLLF